MAGRPKKTKAENRSDVFRMRLTVDERKQIAQTAKDSGLDESAWARMILLAASKKNIQKAVAGPMTKM